MPMTLLRKLGAFAMIVAAVAFVVWPTGPRGEIAKFDGQGSDGTSPKVTRHTFRLNAPLSEITLAGKPRLRAGYVQTKLTYGESSATFGMKGRDGYTSGFSFGRTFEPGNYTLEVTEAPGTRGGWKLIIARHPPVPWTSRLLWLFIALALIAGVVALVRSRDTRAPQTSRLKAQYVFRMFAFALFLMVLYPVIHELGHMLALTAFGVADFSRADFIGLAGTPHAGGKPGVQLQPWQTSVTGISGPLFPVIVGFLLIAAWRLRRETFKTKPVLESMWLWAAGILLVGNLVSIPLVLGIIPPDGDYNNYTSGFPGPQWLAKTLLIVVALATIPVLAAAGKRLLELGRQYMPAQKAPPGTAS